MILIVKQAHHMFQEKKTKEKKRNGFFNKIKEKVTTEKDELLGCYLLAYYYAKDR